MSEPGPDDAVVELRELAPIVEFACWVALAIAPLLRWINGPAVTFDQFVTQMIVLSLAVIGAFGLRAYNWSHRNSRDH